MTETGPVSAEVAEAIRERLANAPAPLALKDLLKGLPGAPTRGAKKAAFEAAVGQFLQREVADGRAFRFEKVTKSKGAEKRTELYWRKSEDDLLRAALLVAAESAKTTAQLAKVAQKAVPGVGEARVAGLLRQLEEEGQLHEYPGKKFATQPPPKPRPLAEVVDEGLRQRAAVVTEPTKEADLKKGLKRRDDDTKAFNDEVTRVLAKLIAEGVLYEHPKQGSAKVYGRQPPPPPPWYETTAYRKPLAAFVKVVRDGTVPAESVLAHLREILGALPTPVVTPEPPKPPVDPPPEEVVADLRSAIREAYDYLCLFHEFRDKLVEIPRLYHETAKRYPGLSVETLHRELTALSDEWKIELHKLNEVHAAKDRHLAIERDDRLYYYVMWK